MVLILTRCSKQAKTPVNPIYISCAVGTLKYNLSGKCHFKKQEHWHLGDYLEIIWIDLIAFQEKSSRQLTAASTFPY